MMHIPKLKKFHYILLAFLLTLLYFALLMFYFEPAISTPDAQGYFSQAKLIAKEGHTYFEPESKLEYIGPHWLSEGNNRYYTTFPPGFPFILAIAYNIISPKASLLLNPLLASLSLFILFLLVSLLISDGWGLIAMLLFAINPIANEHSLFGDSHTIVIFFLILALLCLVKWIKTKSLLWICSAGFFFGIIPTIRYAETLFLFAFGIFILFHFQKNKTFWHSLIAATIGASIPLITLSIRNQLVFGAFWKTGYKVSSESSHFGLMYFLKYFLPYLQQLLFDGLGLIFLLGLIGFVYLCYQQKTRKIGFLFILLVFPITFLYMSYMWKPDPQSMRFLLPTFPIYIISTVWLLKIIINKYFRIGITISILLLFFSIIGGLSMSIMKMQHLKNNNAVLVKITNVIENEIERKSIIITNEAISQNLDFLGYWYLSDMSIFKANLDSSQISIPEHKKIRNQETNLIYQNLTNDELFHTFSMDIWQWADNNNSKVYILGKIWQIDWIKRHLSAQDKLITISKIELPDFSNNHFKLPNNKPPFRSKKQSKFNDRQPSMMMHNQIYDLILDGEPLFLLEWKKTI